MTDRPVPTPSSVTWKVRDWATVWLLSTVAGLVVAAIVVPFWQSDIAGPAFFFFVALPAQAVVQIVALAFIMVRNEARLDRDLGLDIRLTDLRVVPFAIANAVALAFLIEPMIRAFDIADQSQTQLQLFGEASPAALFLGVLLAVGFAPIFEELLFRGMLQRALAARLGRWSTIIVTAAIFAIMHLATVDPEAGQWTARALVVVLSIFLLGLVLSWIADRDGRLGRAIVFHSTHNLVAIVATVVLASDLAT